MTDESSDPLKNADIGETARVRKSKTLYGIDYTPREFFGDDRITADISIVDVELLDNDDGAEDIRITWEGDVMKRLPRRWDYHAEPLTETENRQARRQKWKRRLGQAIAVVVPLGFSFFIAMRVMEQLAGKMTINGESVTPPSPETMAITFGFIVVISAVMMWGMNGAFPRGTGGNR